MMPSLPASGQSAGGLLPSGLLANRACAYRPTWQPLPKSHLEKETSGSPKVSLPFDHTLPLCMITQYPCPSGVCDSDYVI